LVKFGISQLLIFNSCFFAFSGVSGFFINIPPTPKQGSKIDMKIALADLLEGLKAIVNTKGLNAFFATAIAINLFSAGYIGLFYLLANEKGFSLEQYGYVMFMMSLGGFLGALYTSLVKIKAEKRPIFMVVGFLLGGILMFVGLATENVNVMAFGFLIGNLLNAIGNVILNSTIFILIPHDKRATVLGYVAASSMGGFALSTLIYGLLAENYSITNLSLIGTVIGTLITMILFLNKVLMREVVESGRTEEEKEALGQT